MAVNHIHKSAPGPPSEIAVARPAILPVPMVHDRVVIKARNGDMSLLHSPFGSERNLLSLPHVLLLTPAH